MKSFLFIYLACFITFNAFSEEKTDSVQTQKNPIQISGNIQLTNNGISPVPAFALGKPALMTSFSIRKGNFSFSPAFNYGIDGKPWVSNSWLRVQFPSNKFTFRTGLNWSLFFKRTSITENAQTFEVQRANKYLEFEGAVSYKVAENASIQALCWYTKGMDIDAVKYGYFYSLSASINKIRINKDLKLTLRPNLFFIDNSIPFNGLFVSGIAIWSFKNLPISISMQAVKPLITKPQSDFNWNIGLNFDF
ncbi:hypothetical protein Emtol_3028 [Emticicia oligotrophica DSM 17448]|uniref:DUF481 domain-containing protein n=1 Tax=Emticicia oligotrophica (strain DSM 17448 / CIP 109782 / MTCC 6937 / GPTSA100-15) TaxID=929562 RepID=A0ABN4APS0_EMTOG|nr:hypothetical protein [Emticicia oligotrophica]AFK04161.1 hypothetical protein Emtol_3028 [Emticicia oligotrophica DSM 17448]